MLAAETGRQRALLERVHDGVRRAEKVLQYDPHACVRAPMHTSARRRSAGGER